MAAATLGRVLWLHPTHLTQGELLLNMFAEEGPGRERFERAIRDLVTDGLLRMEGSSSRPTLRGGRTRPRGGKPLDRGPDLLADDVLAKPFTYGDLRSGSSRSSVVATVVSTGPCGWATFW